MPADVQTTEGSSHAGDCQEMSLAQLDLANKSRVEAQQSIGQIEAAKARKKDYTAALNAARRLQRCNVVHGHASPADYARAVAECKHALAGKGIMSAWLLKFCKSHGIQVETPATGVDMPVDTWSNALDTLQMLQVLNGVCDEARISMPVSENKITNKEEWERVVACLQNRLNSIGMEIQAQMEQLQNFMGQYDSYTKRDC